MNRLHYLICAKTQYDIQSPFMFDLYQNVIAPKLDGATLSALGIERNDRFGQLCFKLADHYHANAAEPCPTLPGTDKIYIVPDGSMIGVVRAPHRTKDSEEAWGRLFKELDVTLSVDLYDAGLLFTNKKLSKQHLLFRVL